MKKRKWRSTFRIWFGLLLIAAAAGLTGYNIWDDSRAASEANAILEIIYELRSEKSADNTGQDGSLEHSEMEEEPDPDRAMPAVTIDGYRYIGTVALPSLAVELPVMEEWDYERMKISPCRYSGSVYRNDLVICAHNYSSHFGRLDKLQAYDDVIVTDAEGNVYWFEVAQIETLPGTAVEEMTSGDWDLTLFTCNYSGRARVTVRCRSKNMD